MNKHARVMIAGTHSGCGKTTVACALLGALKQGGHAPAAFKCGPDYIDPMFHRKAAGVPARNLDPFFLDPAQLRQMFAMHAGEVSVIEGVMGYYDGVGMTPQASAYAVAKATKTPVILVVNAKGMANSAAAMLHGYKTFREDSGIAGVIFNGISPSMAPAYARAVRETGVRPLGCLPRAPELSIASRHLGLTTADEITDIRQKLEALGVLALEHIDMDGVLRIAGSAEPLASEALPQIRKADVRIAIARDEAFCFLYEENLELLRALGGELVFFSPLKDARLPEGCGGLYLCGGYPELYARALADNASMRNAVRDAVRCGMPTIAECGGFLYLHDELDGFPMAGAIRARAQNAGKLTRFGYATLHAREDNLLCKAGERLPVHEFHYYESDSCGEGFTAHKAGSDRSWAAVHTSETLYAGFPHLYFYAAPAAAERFVAAASAFAGKGGA